MMDRNGPWECPHTQELGGQYMGKAANNMKSFWQLPVDAFIAITNKLPEKNRFFAALYLWAVQVYRRDRRVDARGYLPYEQDLYIIPKLSDNRREHDDHKYPVPPKHLWLNYGVSANEYLSLGETHVNKMISIAKSSDFRFREGNRILDFGCAAGRMIRWLDQVAAQCEIWGVDINARSIKWCQQNLSPPFKFATITTTPHLPFEDRYFDFTYCGSVFTHIDDLADAWLLEIKRITAPGGRIFITVHDKHTADLVMNHPEECRSYAARVDRFRSLLMSYDKKTNFTKSDYGMFSIYPGGPQSQVFYDIDFLQRHWEGILDVLSVTPEAYGYQTAILLKK
jgi:ubiquinone/menaquinone biosynthesis C-methylase UbiE